MTYENVPNEIKVPVFKSFFLSASARGLLKTISSLRREINEVLIERSSKECQMLRVESFWQNLKSTENQTALDQIYETWKRVESFAHLSSKQLVTLYQEKIIPLIRANKLLYSLMLKNTLFEETAKDIQTQIESNETQLNLLSEKIKEALFLRCQLVFLSNMPRQIDDVVYLISQKINSLHIAGIKIPLTNLPSRTLNDDRRFAIYDILCNSVEKDLLYNIVLSNIPKQGQSTFIDKEKVDDEISLSFSFRKKLIADLGLQQLGADLTKEKKNRVSWLTWWGDLSCVISSFLQKNVLDNRYLNLLLNLKAIEYLGYVLFSFMAYYILVSTCIPFLSIFLSASAIASLSLTLFVTVGLAPFWYIGGQYLRNILSYGKQSETLDALLMLENAERYICNHLSRPVVDLPHFEIDFLLGNAKAITEQLEITKIQLSEYFIGEKLICPAEFQEAIVVLTQKIEEMQSRLKSRLSLIASHISHRVREDITLLDTSSVENSLNPILSVTQLTKFRDFVKTFGTKETISSFENNTNLAKLWFNKLDICCTLKPEGQKTITNQPWGHFEVREGIMAGWKKLITSSLLSSEQTTNFLKLHNLLTGKRSISMNMLRQILVDILPAEEVDQALDKIQNFLFKTTDSKLCQNAALFSPRQKQLVADWHQKHLKEIKSAISFFTTLLKEALEDECKLRTMLNKHTVSDLRRQYEMIEGADLQDWATSQVTRYEERRCAIKTLCEQYQGQTSEIIKIFKFISDQDKPDLLVKVAQKRLTWLLASGEPSKALDENDSEIFHHPLLLLNKPRFCFSSILREALSINKVSEQMKAFLKICKEKGFDSASLYDEIELGNGKPFVPGFKLTSLPPKTCGDVSESVLSLSNQDKIHVY